ncbi:uncharacterized protein [Solanum tuberosum]|uniref:uncharacterized protein n=1 Tax=Solanum tuberosum TaxID=4113 RepID=UPI00073A432A|nr:PREDICTED: uncharacterized protein LOC107058697 [Solanum tuberosum]
MSVRDYNHMFNFLARYAPDIVRTMRARVHHYVDGLGDHLIKDCRVASLSDDVDISRIQAFAQTTKELCQRIHDTRRDRKQSKRARTMGSYREPHGDFSPPFHRYPLQPAGSVSPQCGKPHTGQSTQGSGACYYCGQTGNFISCCPRLSRGELSLQDPQKHLHPQSVPNVRDHILLRVMTEGEVKEIQDSGVSPDVVTGILTISSQDVYALIDPGSTFSYTTPFIASKIEMKSELLPQPVEVSTLVGDSILASLVYRGYTMIINNHPIPADLVELIMLDFDVIMDMDWLAACYANIDCRAKIVRFYFPGEPVLEWKGNVATPKGKFISYLRARKLIAKGCMYHTVHVQGTNREPMTLQSIPIMNEFPMVFLDDLPGIPLERVIDFAIDLFPDMQHLSIPPYRMTTTELRELKEQLKDLLDKGFIRPSTSPWGAPMLFVRKKDGSL